MKKIISRNVHIDVTAFHEAGHCLAALQAGCHVNIMFVSKNRPGVGLVMRSRLDIFNPFLPGSDSVSVSTAWNYVLHNIRKEMRIFLAGPLAEAKYLGLPLRSLGSESDLIKCQNLANRADVLNDYYRGFYPIPILPGYEIMNEVKKSTRQWLGHPKTWKIIEAIATQGIKKRKLNGSEICNLIGREKESKFQPTLDLC